MTTFTIDRPIPQIASRSAIETSPMRRDDSLDSLEGEFPLFPHDPDTMDAIVISDLHLGSDNCQAKPAAAFLQSLIDGTRPARRLIINGDVFDSIDFRRLKKTHWKVLSQIRHLSDKMEVIWIVGNHDGSADIISHLLGVKVVEEFILSSGHEKILIVHGHQFDDFINDHPILTMIADAIYLVLQRIDRTHHIARLAKRRSKIFVRCTNKIREGARQLALSKGCTIALCGHTHHVESVEATPQVMAAYHNSGCWTETPSTYVTVHAGKVSHHQFSLVEEHVATISA